MNRKPKVVKLQKTKILENNKKIDARVVDAQTKLEHQLKGVGVEVKPEFKIEPPLGQGRMRLLSRNY